MKNVIEALRDWLMSKDHPALRFKGAGVKLQVVFLTDHDAYCARMDLAREVRGDEFMFSNDKGGIVLDGVPVEFHGPKLVIDR